MIHCIFKNLSQGPAPFWTGPLPARPNVDDTLEFIEFNRVKVIKILWREGRTSLVSTWNCEVHVISDLARI